MVATHWPAAREFSEAIQNPSLSFIDPELKASIPVFDRLGMPLVTSGQFAYVFKLKATDGTALAVRCFRGFLGDREQRYQAIDDYLSKINIRGLASFEYDPEGITFPPQKYPILKMQWLEGLPLDVYVSDFFRRADVLKDLADRWVGTIGCLKAAGVHTGIFNMGIYLSTTAIPI
jgi:hypothetical protein